MSADSISIVAPVFNEAANLHQLHQELVATVRQIPVAAEILWVDDQSTDGSFELLQSLSEQAPANLPVRVLQLPRHLGQSAAIWYGIQHADAGYVATLDSDLQNDPSDLPRLFEFLRSQSLDLVSGVRAGRQDSWLRKRVSKVANQVRRSVLGDPFTDIGCSLKIYRREFLVGLPPFNGLHRFLPVLCVWNGARSGELAVNHRARTRGESKYGAIRGRLSRGIADLLAMAWLRSRWLAFETQSSAVEARSEVDREQHKEQEQKQWKDSPSGWSSGSSDSPSSSLAS